MWCTSQIKSTHTCSHIHSLYLSVALGHSHFILHCWLQPVKLHHLTDTPNQICTCQHELTEKTPWESISSPFTVSHSRVFLSLLLQWFLSFKWWRNWTWCSANLSTSTSCSAITLCSLSKASFLDIVNSLSLSLWISFCNSSSWAELGSFLARDTSVLSGEVAGLDEELLAGEDFVALSGACLPDPETLVGVLRPSEDGLALAEREGLSCGWGRGFCFSKLSSRWRVFFRGGSGVRWNQLDITPV